MNKISDLINKLKDIQLEYGDLEYGKLKYDSYNNEPYLIRPEIEVIDSPYGEGKVLMIEKDENYSSN